MNPIRREFLNGLFVLVVASLMSAAFAAFQISVNLQLWVLILIGVGVAITGYVMFDVALRFMASAEGREKEWLKRVGTPARLSGRDDAQGGTFKGFTDAINALTPSSDYVAMSYFGPETQPLSSRVFDLLLDRLKQGRLREYKRIICFDNDVLANDQELRSGVLRVGEGPGTIDPVMGEHCRLIMKTKGCSLYLAPAVVRFTVVLLGVDKVAMSVDTAQPTGGRAARGAIFFCDPPNGEIIEQFRQMERETEKQMVAVREIRFPEDEVPTAEVAAR